MALKKSSLKHYNEHFQQPQLQQIPNRKNNNINMHASSSQFYHKSEDDELAKNISSEYQEIQLRTLTKWINNQLKQVGEQITSIAYDLKDGTKLLKLLSVVADHPHLKPEKGNMRIHHLSNVAQALNFLKEQWGIDSLPAIANESIVNGDTKSILALTFFIMLKYQIHPILKNKAITVLLDSPLPSVNELRSRPSIEAKLALLSWVRYQLEDYITHHIITNIQDFSRSWRSGLAFCLLLHRHNPELIPTLFTDILQQPTNKDAWYMFLDLAFDVAENQLNIPRYLDPEDLLVEFPHEPSVMMYVSEMYNIMVHSTDSSKEERLHDIMLLKSTDSDESLSQQTLYESQDSITPSESSTRAEDNMSQPEETQDEHLDILSSFVHSHLERYEEQVLFNMAYSSRHESESPVFEALESKYKNLEWEEMALYQDIIPKDANGEPIHPLDGTIPMAEAFERSLSDVLISKEYNDQQVLMKLQNTCHLFRRGVMFAQILLAIRAEMDVIQQLMMNGDDVNEELVYNLEQRIYIINTTIQGARDEYQHDLLLDYKDARFINSMEELEKQYKKVFHWVGEVRVWFKEAGRIRSWIEDHIKLITARNSMDYFNPLAAEVNIDHERAIQLYEDHEKLKREIESFDSDDMAQLKANVKWITASSDSQKELSPADTSIIGITLKTLNLLNKLTQLLNARSQFVRLNLLRLKWEEIFASAVQWIATMEQQMNSFLQGKARWSEKMDTSNNQDVEDVIETLVFLEREVSNFDYGCYTDVLNAYEDLENAYKQKLPDYLELRQVGFEKAFEDVMKRSAFSRKVVEQLLSTLSTVEKFKKLRQVGENLKKNLQEDSSAFGDEDRYTESVQNFKEESAFLITNASTYIPYPTVPRMSTAIGSSDAQDTEITNGNIKSAISAYSMALALITDVLDQLLMSHYQISSLQSRVDEAITTITRMTSWMDEKTNLLQEVCFDMLLFDVNPDNRVSKISVAMSISEEMHRLEKERDIIAEKFYTIENEELVKCYNTVKELEKDIDSANAVSIDRNSLVSHVENLEHKQRNLKESLFYRGLQLDTLKKRTEWENQWLKVSNQIQTIAHKTLDFCFNRALYNPCVENIDKPSYQGDRDILQLVQSLQERVVELDNRLFSPLQDAYVKMEESYSTLCDYQSKHEILNMVLHGDILKKQEDLAERRDALKHLSLFTANIVTQRSSITEFLLRAYDAHQEGEKIKDAFAKKTKFIMTDDTKIVALTERVANFKQEIKSIWQDCKTNISSPDYNSDWSKLLNQQQKQSSNIDLCVESYSQISRQIKELLNRKMKALSTLDTDIDQCLSVYSDANVMKALVIKYEQEASDLGAWISTQVEFLKSQYFDVSAENLLPQDLNIPSLSEMQSKAISHIDDFEREKVKVLHDNIVLLLDDSDKKKTIRSVDFSPATNKFAQMMSQLSELKQGIEDQSIALDAAHKRIIWENRLQLGISRLESIHVQVRQFTVKKNQIVSQDELIFTQVQELQQDLVRLIHQKDEFQNILYPDIQTSYDVFIECFPKLSKPMATPDHLELRMESLNGLSTRLQDNIDIRSCDMNLIEQRLNWEDLVKQALVYLSKQEKIIDSFIEQKARWKNDLIKKHSDEAELRQEWSVLSNEFKTYEHTVIEPLKKQYKALIENLTEYCSNNTTPIIPRDRFTEKLNEVQQAQTITSYCLDFSSKVVDQRFIVSAFILKTVNLEQSAELIREELISINLQNGDDHIISQLLEDYSGKLQSFKTNVEDVQNNLAAKIPFPIRALDYYSTQTKIKDEASNSVIRETVTMYSSRLGELFSSLQQILESKERVSRRKLSLHYYKKQAKLIDAWITSRQQAILFEWNIRDIKRGIRDLEKVVSQISSIEQTMISSDNLFTKLLSLYNKCKMAFEDDSMPMEVIQEENQQLPIDDFDTFVQPTQDRLQNAWDDLLANVLSLKKDNQTQLVTRKIEFWVQAIHSLMHSINTVDEHTISNKELCEHENELKTLEEKHYFNLKSDVESCKSILDKLSIDSVQQLLQDGLLSAKSLRATINGLKTRVQFIKLTKKYCTDVSYLQGRIQQQKESFVHFYQSQPPIQIKSTSDVRQNQYQELFISYKGITKEMPSLQEIFDNVNEQYDLIMKQDVSFDSTAQRNIKSSWKDLIEQQKKASLQMSQYSKWMSTLESLDGARTDVESILERIQDESSSLDALIKESSKVYALLRNDLKNVDAILVNDHANFKNFEQERLHLLEQLADVEKSIRHTKKKQEKSSLIQKLEDAISKICLDVNGKLSIAEDHCKRFSLASSAENFSKYVDFASQVVNSNNKTIFSCQQEIDSLHMNVCSGLTQEFNWKDFKLFDPLTQMVNRLVSLTRMEKEHIDIAMLLKQFISRQSRVEIMLKNFTHDVSAMEISQSKLSDIEYELESLESSVSNLEILYQDVLQFKFEESIHYEKNCLVASIERIEKKHHTTNEDLAAIKILLENKKHEMNDQIKYQQIMVKLGDILKDITDMMKKVSHFEIRRESMDTNENEFNELCALFYQALNANQCSVKTLIDSYGLKKDIGELNEEISSSIIDLNSAIELKRKEFGEQDTSEFLRLVSIFNKHIVSLISIIDKASPTSSNLIHNSFVKSDLQLLLKNLVSSFKQYKRLINDILDKAIIESKRHHLVGNSLVEKKLDKIKRQWAKTQSAASARERELKTCIYQLDHEFFTKLAMAKSNGAVHKVSRSTSVRSLPVVSPVPSIKKNEEVFLKRKPYVPNPNNELDVKLSQIINSSPYKITVKVVPDQIGKYWFGDVNPRLVYCRILPSKLVMVRVGGGWVELSKFLREHGFIDSSCSRPDSVNETRKQENFPQSKRPMSPANRVIIRGGGLIQRTSSNSSLKRSCSKASLNSPRSPLPGYLDGDRFVSIDENGNQHYVKMKKASDDATTPIISKKKH